MELLTKVAVGVSRQRLTFSDWPRPGSIYLSTFSQSRDVFNVVPEIGATFGYQFTPRLRGTVGYTVIYWDKVARLGNHLQLPFEWHDSMLVHGLSAGLECRY